DKPPRASPRAATGCCPTVPTSRASASRLQTSRRCARSTLAASRKSAFSPISGTWPAGTRRCQPGPVQRHSKGENENVAAHPEPTLHILEGGFRPRPEQLAAYGKRHEEFLPRAVAQPGFRETYGGPIA